MLRSRLFWEILAPFLVCAVLASALVLWYGGVVRRQTLERAMFQRLESISGAIGMRGIMFRKPVETWNDELARFAAKENLRLTVISGDGTPLADTAVDIGVLENQENRPDIQAASRSGVGRLRGRERLSVVAAVHDWGGGKSSVLLGFVRASAARAVIEQGVWQWRMGAAALAAIVAGCGLVWTAIVGRRLAHGVSTLTSGIEMTIETGRPPPRAGTGRSLARLSTAFSDLTNQLSRRIAELREENARLRHEGEQQASVLAGMAEGVLAVDRNEVILFANRATSVLLGLPEQKLIGRPLWEAVRLAAIHEATRAALAGLERDQIEIDLPRSQTVIALRARPLPGADSPGAVLVLHDITELKRLENLRREFVSNVSHELKTPLASIQAYTETLLDGAIDDAEYNKAFLKRIDEQVDRLHHLILDLLRLARIEAGTDVFEIQQLTASMVIGPCVEEHLAVARSRGLELITEPPDEPIRLQADPEGLRTILDNLLDNALHYTPDGGRVTIRWSRADGMVLIEVADTGIGIPPEHLQRIFERFHRVDKARSRERGGTGLGLAIVKHLVHVFGGRTEVESEVGRGSVFRVWLPAG